MYGYILVKSAKTDSATNVKEVSTDTEKKKESSSTSDKKKKTTSTKSGSQACNISNGGYDSIYTSGTTGRQFKEFKQNSGSFAYPSVVGTYWGQECSTVAIGTIGSGYKNLSFNDLAKKEDKCIIIVTHSKNVSDYVDKVYELNKDKK